MTVQALSLSLAYCAWGPGGHRHHGTFEVDSLHVVDPAPRKAAGLGKDRRPSAD